MFQNKSQNTGRFTVQGKPVVTFRQVMKEMHWGFRRTQSMQQPCPYLDDEPLVFRWERSPLTSIQVQMIDEATLDVLKQKAKEAGQGRFVHKGEPFLSRERSLRELRLSGLPRVRRHSLINWSRGPCRILGERLRTQRFALEGRGGASLWCLEEHILRIKRNLLKIANAERKARNSFSGMLRRLRQQAGMTQKQLAAVASVSVASLYVWENGRRLADPPAAHRLARALGVTAKELKLTVRRRKQPLATHQAFDGVFRDSGEEAIAYNIRIAARELGCSCNRVEHHIRRLPEEFRSIFPEQGRLPSESMRVPGTKNCWQTAIRVEHIRTLKEGIDKILNGTKWAKNLRSATEICDQHGVNNYSDRIEVSAFLHRLAKAGILTGQRVPQKRPNSRRRWINPMMYETGEVDRYLSGRDLVEAARSPATQLSGQLAREETTQTQNGRTAGSDANPLDAACKRADHPDYPSHCKKPYSTGRRPNVEREVVLKACYDRYMVSQQPAVEVQEGIANDFGPRYSPKSKDEVKHFAREWSERFAPPLPTKRDEAAAKFSKATGLAG